MKRITYITEEHRIKTIVLPDWSIGKRVFVPGITIASYQIFNIEKRKWETKLRRIFVKDVRVSVENSIERAYYLRYREDKPPVIKKNLASGLPTPISRAQVQ